MICPHCQQETSETAKFCKHCGGSVQQQAAPSIPVPPIPTPPVPPIPTPPVATPVATPVVTEDMLPEQYRPLSPWAYFGLSLLFAVPIVGFVFLIVFSFSRGNIHRRNYARSYWCALIIVAAIALVAVILGVALGGSLAAMYR